ncbi:protein ELC-like [Silene latifolia]|uniref:protein ELC-like n=1 Tax=Silene latifolia TaxID=37657 RepID=UPI003D76ED19
MEFVDTKLFSDPSILSYKDPTQKSLIRNHILHLIHDFPAFKPSNDTFFHVDGAFTELLKVSGLIPVSKILTDVPLVIWLHENYPVMAPMVYVGLNPDCPVHENHPFIDKSGVIAETHLNWDPHSSLCTLVHNLASLFVHDHPSMPSSILKMTVLDDLVPKVCKDFATINTRNRNEIEKWYSAQDELRRKASQVDGEISRLLVEREELEKRVIELRNYKDRLEKWVSTDTGAVMDRVETLTVDDAVEGIDVKSNVILESRAEDEALEDVMYALDKALVEGVMCFSEYMRRIRVAAREQFRYRDVLVKLKASLS